MLWGSSVLKSYSKTQGTIARSLAESELIAVVNAACEAIGTMSLAVDLGIALRVRLHVSTAAALGILERQGVGQVRHLDIGVLWFQEQQLRGVVELTKVFGTSNPNDLMIKHLIQESLNQYRGTPVRLPPGKIGHHCSLAQRARTGLIRASAQQFGGGATRGKAMAVRGHWPCFKSVFVI